MIENWYQYEIFTSYLSPQEETADVNILVDHVIIQNATSKSKTLLSKLFFTYLARHKALVFGFHKYEGQPRESPFFLLLESENKVEKSCFYQELWSLKIVHRFSIFKQKCWRQQNYGNLGVNWYVFSKALMVHYHCTKFLVSSISLSRVMGHGQKHPLGLNRPKRA